MISNDIGRGLAVVLLASSLGACSHVSSAWSKLRGHDDTTQTAGSFTDTTVQSAAAPAADPQVCNTLRMSAAPSATAEAASRQMAIDEMNRIGCPDVPAL
jgi:hypothetical protein